MHFCDNCDNMLYMKIGGLKEEFDKTELDKKLDLENNKIIYFCRSCNKEYPDLHKKDSCIYSVNYNTENIQKQSFINKYIYDDATLPTAENIKCINKECPGKDKPNIKNIQYDKDNMKYIYICMKCYEAGIENHIW